MSAGRKIGTFYLTVKSSVALISYFLYASESKYSTIIFSETLFLNSEYFEF